MQVGVGLPTTTPGARGPLLLEWARRADPGPFASLGTLDRVVYESFDPLAALASAAAVTARVELVTMIVIAPIRAPVLLAKQAATVHSLSAGRLTLGLASGARPDDYQATGSDLRTRGARFDDLLEQVRTSWEDGHVAPAAPDGSAPPRILVGGLSGRAFARMARLADGYVHGGGPPRAFAGAAARALTAWVDLGRPGRPLLYGQAYFALGSADEIERGAAYLRHYYAFTGPFAEKVAAANLTTPASIKDFIRGYEEAGCDELVLLPTVASLDQLDRLADVVA
jgi:alkanesulfonate monooxygenase SsuD/methylene tetrahydromethanopterin reductase-like flavin-dependent oxidoreductase (luciferase family)